MNLLHWILIILHLLVAVVSAGHALLFKRDSVHGAFSGTVEVDGNDLIINGKRIHVTAERDPANLPHAANGVDIALECTGRFNSRDKAAQHLENGSKRVLVLLA